jgi:hypothetical protein
MSKELPSGAGEQNQGTEINCFSCCHFYITYETQFPYGCRKAGFKSRLMPSKVMYVYSGIECQLFLEKENPQKSKSV